SFFWLRQMLKLQHLPPGKKYFLQNEKKYEKDNIDQRLKLL
ncbi:unnamed protein product, partial [marine sediment metagenome]